MKYLGMQISDDLKNTEHVKKRIKDSFIDEARIKSLGLINSQTSPFLIAQLFKTFFRPKILYGMESLDLTKTEVNSLRKAETNVLKRLLGLTVQCKQLN